MEKEIQYLLCKWYIAHNSLKPIKMMETYDELKTTCNSSSVYYNNMYQEIYNNIKYNKLFVFDKKISEINNYNKNYIVYNDHLFYKKEDGTYQDVIPNLESDFSPISCVNYYYCNDYIKEEIQNYYSMQYHFLQWEERGEIKYKTFPQFNLVVFYTLSRNNHGINFGNIKNAITLTFASYYFDVNQFSPKFKFSIEKLNYLIH